MRSNKRTCAATMVGAALGIALVLAPRYALAGEEDSKTMFARGRELRLQNKCDEAILEFRRALDVYPEGLGSLRNIAECEEQLGRFAAARRDWWDLRRAVLQSNLPKYSGWEKDAQEAYDRLATRVARVTIVLTGDKLERVKIVMDGKPLDPRLVGTPLERDLGTHTIEAFYGGAAPVAEKITLTEGSNETVTLAIPMPAPPPSPPRTDAPTGSPGMRAASYVALGVGGVAAVGALVSVVVRQAALSSLEEECPGYETGPCPASVASVESRGEAASTLVNVFGAVAIAGLGAGIPLFVLSAPGSAPGRGGPSTSVRVVPTAGGAVARGEVRF